MQQGFAGVLSLWPSLWGTAEALEAWTWFVVFGIVQGLMQLFVPGKDFEGPVSPKGNVPKYKVLRGYCLSAVSVPP